MLQAAAWARSADLCLIASHSVAHKVMLGGHLTAMCSGQARTCCADADLDIRNGVAEEVALAAVVGVCLQVDAHAIAARLAAVALVSAGPAAAQDLSMLISGHRQVHELLA